MCQKFGILCSGHGECISESCVCYEGWISVSDFAVVPGEDCDINILTIKIMLYTSIVLASISIAYTCRYLYLCHIARMTIRDLNVLFPVLFLIHNAYDVIYAIGKVINPMKYVVGKSIWLSILFSLSMWAGFGGLCMYLLKCAYLLNKLAKVMSSEAQQIVNGIIFTFIIRIEYYLVIIGMFLSLASFGLLVSKSKYIAFGMSIFIGAGVSAAVLSYLFNITVALLLEQLKSSMSSSSSETSSNKIDNVYSTLVHVKNLVNIFALTFAITLILFGAWPFLLRKVVYVMLASAIAFHPVSLILIYSVKLPSNKITPTNLNTV